MPATYEKIATTTLGSAGTITFSSIAASWTDLRLVLTGSPSSSGNQIMTFNSDTTTIYSNTSINGSGTTATSARATGDNAISQSYMYSGSNISLLTYDIFSYAGSTFKTVLITGSTDQNGSGLVRYSVGLWRSTSAITSIDLGRTMSVGTTATLYGILKA